MAWTRRKLSVAVTERTPARLRAHWEIERELADRLRRADRDERTALYGSLYDELFHRVTDHPQITNQVNAVDRGEAVRAQQRLITHFILPGATFLEVGAGDCELALAMTGYAGQVYAVEVSQTIAQVGSPPANFELLITDGREIPAPPGTVDLVYSNQLMEHLHPDDATEQLRNIVGALRPGGRYVCLTPNRLLGPADISQYFEEEIASGFHLREYSTRELDAACRGAGFASVQVLACAGNRAMVLPLAPFAGLEWAFEALPRNARLRLKRQRLIRKLLSPGGGLVAIKH